LHYIFLPTQCRQASPQGTSEVHQASVYVPALASQTCDEEWTYERKNTEKITANKKAIK
jgi:hypothetical protein